VKEVPADKAYLSHDNLALVEKLGGTAYVPLWHKNLQRTSFFIAVSVLLRTTQTTFSLAPGGSFLRDLGYSTTSKDR
jgi:hypothetical protein